MTDDTPDTIDLSPVIAADIRQGEFAKLLNISRVTVNQWFNHHHQPHTLLAPKVRNYLDLIQAGIKDGQLPLSPNVGPKDRVLQIKTVIAKQHARRSNR